jgi:hypothetical protein
VYAKPEPGPTNRATRYYGEFINAHPWWITKLGHFTTHIYRLHIIGHSVLETHHVRFSFR